MDERRMLAPWQLIIYMKQRSKDNKDFIALDCGDAGGTEDPPPQKRIPLQFRII